MTKEERQLQIINEWREKMFAMGTSVEPCDHSRAENAVKEFIRTVMGKEFTGKFIWFDSIKQAFDFVKKNSPKEAHNYISPQEELFWIAFYKIGQVEFGVKFDDEDQKKLDCWFELAKTCGWFWPFSKVVVMSERPTWVSFEKNLAPDQNPRLHAINAPAVLYKDKTALYCIRGVRVTKEIAYGEFTAKDIVAQSNAEVRRCMLEMYGEAKFINDIGANVVDSSKFGTLYRVDLPNDEPLMMIKVIDATPQPNGVHKEYWLRVDPNAYGGLRTARAAVASTWRRKDNTLVFAKPEDYRPEIET